VSAAPAHFFGKLEGPPDPDLVRIRELIYQATGIFHPENKLVLLADRCQRRMKELNTKTFGEYLDCLTIKPNRQAELVALLNEITIGETCFFRNQSQLQALCNVVIPRIVEAKARLAVRRMRIWSAGCSTGEEPYTLALLLLEQSRRSLKNWIVEILATDLNERSLAHAKNAVYDSRSTRNLSAGYREQYFTASGGQLQVQQVVRKSVEFKRLNLSDDTHMSSIRGMDIIFCCNVLIYFDHASKRRVIQHFYNSLLPQGYLFLGQTESLYGVADNFQLVHLPGATAYVKDERSQSGKQES
jgi:chemotaxis protein methyltransferase CheR